MRRLSASDAINPAWNHAWSLLIAPRQWRTLLKVGAVACLAQMGGGNGNFTGNIPGHTGPHMPAPFAVGLLIVASLVVFALALLFLYLSSRLQFVLLDIMLLRDTRVAPAWHRHRGQTWRWIGLKLLFFVVMLVCLIPIAVPLTLLFVHLSHGITPGSGETILAVFGFVLLFLLFLFVLIVLYVLLLDFGLPVLAVEDHTIRETVAALWALVRAEPGQLAMYLLVRFLLAFAGGMVGLLGIGVAGLIMALPLGAAGYGLWSGLHADGPGAHLLMIAGMVLLAIVLLVPVVCLYLMVFGFVLCFIQSYALFFLGGRYPAVGEILEPTQPLPPPPPGWQPIAPPFASYT